MNNAKSLPGQAYNWVIYNMSGMYGNSLQFWSYDHLACDGGLCLSRLTLMDNGNVGIGTSNPSSKLTVAGDIRAREIKVEASAGADFVFSDDYRIRSLAEAEQFIAENKHLPDIAPANNMEQEGVNIGEFQIKLLQKIEELTIYAIDLQKQIDELKKKKE